MLISLAACGTTSKEATLEIQTVSQEEAIGDPVAKIPAYLPNENSHSRENPITHIVLHFSSNVLANPADPFIPEDIRQIFIEYGVSAHYMIGRDGEIHQLVPEERVAYDAGKGDLPDFPNYKNRLNEYSIGIELLAIGTKTEMQTMMMSEAAYNELTAPLIGYTDEQYEALDKLLAEIVTRNPQIHYTRQYIVGHDEYAPERKTDPGSLFDWSKIGL
ncbi:N-acetylmuramoyl-L-alanine amidase [Oceanobacillus piezotolerans]|uniref:N-acetylmuramoyl-L-alanine amidase n=2 Tax=Oceanobacillus piezotolerans TaxID=2448030 RepID=A0A498D852_9BACI|nr:N-acetylmuramoyl-L-alanine amidase [Oceanobacillus piezotolerans]